MGEAPFKPKVWVPGDLNAFFGLFTNVLLNVLVLTGLSLGVVNMPGDIVFGRILPALGVALPLGNIFYAYLAYKLAVKEGRDTVTSMPYGPSVPHMFIVVFLVMLPTYLKTNDPILAWKLGLVWALIIGIIIIIGAFVGPTIRKYTPRAAMLGTLAGVSIAFISMRPAFQMFEYPWIGLVCFAIIMLSWMANMRMPFNIPGGLAVVIVGTLLAWGAVLLGGSTLMVPSAVGEALNQFSLHIPSLSGDVVSVSPGEVWPLLVTAIPLGIYNFTEGINNVESASAAGDEYDLRKILMADGLGAIVGAFLGSPFPPAVYIGHPGWKAVGGRIGYSLATGVTIAVVCFFGLTALLLAVVPLVAILPILLFIGLIIGSQAFQTTPRAHAPAIVLAIIPNITEWAKGQVDGAIGAANTSVSAIGEGVLSGANVLYVGMERLGGGAVLAGLMLGAIAVFVIEKRYNWAALYSGIAAVLSFFGFIHGAQLAVNATPGVTIGYVVMAAMFAVIAWKQTEPFDWSPVDTDEVEG
ncbi:MAG: regulator [Methylobacteriaceae bacterium]|jgi:AGZA family xanthine/uracil permease-like MFS transporter|nr:regulator [Methylobacteriaceae bacterium]